MAYKCELCKKEFSSSSTFEYHSKNIVCMKEKKIYKCEICEKEFDHLGNFEKHSNNKTCNSDILKAFKLKNTNLQIQIRDMELEIINFNSKISQLESSIKSIENQNYILNKENTKLKSQLELSDFNKYFESLSNTHFDQLNVIEELLFNNNKLILSFKLFFCIRQIILSHHNNKFFDIIKTIIFKLKTCKDIHKDIQNHLHTILTNNTTIKDDLKITYKYFRCLISDIKSFDKYYKINFEIDSPIYDF
jgi:regulator of replication initiation timing/DNA-directed RNA polymerase subunit RPC12/RpoP